MIAQAVDQSRVEEFGLRMLAIINHGALALMTSIGHRTGLFDVMAGMPPATTRQVAAKAGLSERYVREWLGAMVSGGIVVYDEADHTYRLPPEHAACLTRVASPHNAAVTAQWVGVLGAVEDEVVEAFRHGRGVPYSAYRRFQPVMAEESGQTVVAGLAGHILPLVPGLRRRLVRGLDVLDVGCGSGGALNHLAALYPASRFTGYDISEEGAAAARSEAARRGLTNVRFEVQDVAEMNEEWAYDLVTAFDAIHDQPRPDAVLRNIFCALRPGGTFLMQDIAASSHVHRNAGHAVAPFIYTISCMHCMSVSLAAGGAGLGAAWGKEKALQMLGEAGFGQVRVETLPHDFLNYYYIAPKD